MNKAMLRRWLQHLTTTHLALRRWFPPATLAEIDAGITASEKHHRAEIRCAVETTLPLAELVRGTDSNGRACEVFADLGVWDTAENNGILLYVLIAERKIEIIADRGFDDLVTPAEWRAVCAAMESAFASGRYDAGTLEAVDSISAIARLHFPSRGNDANELPDRTVLL